MEIIYNLIIKYCDSETIITALKSRSKLSRAALVRIKNIQLDDNLDVVDQQLKLYCQKNDLIRLAKLINQFGSRLNWDWGLSGACLGGHRKIVDLMIAKGAYFWSFGLSGACLGGHRELVDLMIAKGATDWNWGLHRACWGGHRELVDLMIAKGATKNYGLYCACAVIRRLPMESASEARKRLHVHRELVDLMIATGATTCNYCQKSIEEHLS